MNTPRIDEAFEQFEKHRNVDRLKRACRGIERDLTIVKASFLNITHENDQLRRELQLARERIEVLLMEAEQQKRAKGDRTELNQMARKVHAANAKWWQDINTGLPIKRNKGELLALIHSEISEALEGERKDLMDDKLPHRKMAEVELADALIRILDYCGGFGYDIEGAVAEKMAYNATREDHKHESRRSIGGKQF